MKLSEAKHPMAIIEVNGWSEAVEEMVRSGKISNELGISIAMRAADISRDLLAADDSFDVSDDDAVFEGLYNEYFGNDNDNG